MKKYLRLPAIILVLLVCSTLVSSAQAGPNAQQVLSMIRNAPCQGILVDEGGAFSYPRVTCNGHKGASAYINILVREWATEPEYNFVGEPFYLGIGQYPGSARISFPTNTLVWDKNIKINNYRIELRSVPVQAMPELAFNGTFYHDSSMDISLNVVREPEAESTLTLTSGGDFGGIYYPAGDGKDIDTLLMSLIARKSSYHAANPTLYQGEPAYRLEIKSFYRIDAQASWSSHQEWEELFVDACVDGPSGSGLYDCLLPDGSLGHEVTIDKSRWGLAQGGYFPSDNDPWVIIGYAETRLVRWPDGRNHDHIPILVYQSQPLLQKP